MIELPDFKKAYEYENNFYLSCDNQRISKILAHYELFKMTKDLPGSIVECGVFKGNSFVRFAGFRDLFRNTSSNKLIGFDIFGAFPKGNFKEDEKYRKDFINDAGEQSITKDQLYDVLRLKGVDKNVELVEGDVTESIPKYLKKNPHLKISLLNLDVDLYEPSLAIINHLWPRVVRGGVLLLDDYGVFPGETKAVDDYFKDTDVKVSKFDFAMTPCYIVKK